MMRPSHQHVRDLIVDVARGDFAPRAPKETLQRVLERRAAGERVLLPVDDMARPPAPARGRRVVPWVVGLVLATAGVAAAHPSSPVRRWLGDLRHAPTPTVATTASEPVSPPRDTTMSGVTVPIAAGEMWVAIEPDSQPALIRVRFTDARELEVRGVGAAAGALFRPRSGGVGVSNIGGGELEVDVPREVRRFVLRVRDVRYVVKNGARIQVFAPNADTTGAELLLRITP